MPSVHSRSGRDVLCAAMIAAFAVTAVTGVLMMVHLAHRSVAVAHEWIGLAFVALALWHVVRNRMAILSYCRRPVFIGSLVVGLAIAGIAVMATQSEPRGRGRLAEAAAATPSPVDSPDTTPVPMAN